MFARAISKTDGNPEERRLAGKPEADLSALHRGRAHGAHQGTQEAGAAITRTDAEGNAAQSEVEHGLHERKTP